MYMLGLNVEGQDMDVGVLANLHQVVAQGKCDSVAQERAAGLDAPDEVKVQGIGCVGAEGPLQVGAVLVGSVTGHPYSSFLATMRYRSRVQGTKERAEARAGRDMTCSPD